MAAVQTVGKETAGVVAIVVAATPAAEVMAAVAMANALQFGLPSPKN